MQKINELRKSTIRSYLDKALDKDQTTITKRSKGIKLAKKKFAEDPKTISELNKSTIRSYLDKAKDSKEAASMTAPRGTSVSKGALDKDQTTITKRSKGIKLAKKKLNEEEVESGKLRFFYTVDGSNEGKYVDAGSRSEAIDKVQQKTGKKPTTIELASDKDANMSETKVSLKENSSFLLAAITDDGIRATEMIQSKLSEKVLAALAERKVDIATNLFTVKEETAS